MSNQLTCELCEMNFEEQYSDAKEYEKYCSVDCEQIAYESEEDLF